MRVYGEVYVCAGLGTWGVMKGWAEHVEKRSVQFLSGLGVGVWMGLSLMRQYKRVKYGYHSYIDFFLWMLTSHSSEWGTTLFR